MIPLLNKIRAHLPDAIYKVLAHPRFRRLVPFGAGFVVLVLLVAGVAYSEYRTNWFARRLGAFLLASNSLRPQTGALWKQIVAQSETQNAIDKNNPMPPSKAGLPDPVIKNRFESSRVPESGAPTYVAIWKTPLPGLDLNARSLDDVITSLRIYRQGLAIVEALHLPDVHFYGQVRERFPDLYVPFDEIEPVEPDTLFAADSLGVLNPDSLRAAVFEELAAGLIPELRRDAHAALVKAYKAGQIVQIFLDRDLGRFRGELHRERGLSSVTFEIDAKTVSEIMKLPESVEGL